MLNTLNKILSLLSRKQKVGTIYMFILLLINSLVEIFGIGAVIPLLNLLIEDNIIENYAWAKWLYVNLNLKDVKHLIVIVSLLVFIIFCIKNIATIWIRYIQSKFSFNIYKDLSLKVLNHGHSKGLLYYKSINSSNLVRDIKDAPSVFSSSIYLNFLTLYNELIITIAISIFLLIYNFKVCVTLFAFVLPIFLVFYIWVQKKNIELNTSKQKVEPEIYKNIYHSIFGYIDIVISSSYEFYSKRIKKNLNTLTEINIKTFVYNIIPSKIIESSIFLAVSVIIAFGVFFFDSMKQLVELLGIFIIAAYKIMPSINRISIASNSLTQNSWVFDSLSPLIYNSADNNLPKQIPIEFKNELKLESVSFKYPSQDSYIFKNFSLKIKKGEVIGLFGASGSGKTTLLNILMGFVIPTKGKYMIDNTTYDKTYFNSLCNIVGYVQQHVYLMDSSIAENIAFGYSKNQIDYKKIDKVLKQADLTEMVNKLPEGSNTQIGENGTKISGGQRQRIGIARALYFDSEILFFDESTSSLDNKSGKQIMDSIYRLNDGKMTIIIISHNLNSLADCDRIIKI